MKTATNHSSGNPAQADSMRQKRLTHELRQKSTRLRLMQSVSSAMRRRLSANDRIRRILNIVKHHFKDCWLAYFAFDKEKNLVLVHGVSPRSNPDAELSKQQFVPSQEYIRSLRRRRNPHPVANIEQNMLLSDFGNVCPDLKMTAALQIPVSGKDAMHGVLSLFDAHERSWSDHECDALSEVADYLAIAIEDACVQDKNRKAVETLKKRERRLQKIVHNMPVMVVVFDKAGKLVLWNRECEFVTGYAFEEVRQSPELWQELCPYKEFRKSQAALPMAQGPDRFDHEWSLKTKDGCIKTVAWSSMARRFPISGWDCWGIGLDVTERKQSDEVVRNISEGVAAFTGEQFFESLTRYLGKTLQVNFAMVGVLTGENRDRIRTMAIHGRGSTMQNLEYDLKGTPCEQVVNGMQCIYERDVQARFPKDSILEELKIESYVGLPLFDSQNRVMGLVAIMDTSPLKRTEFVYSVLKIFGVRAAAELERLHAEMKTRESDAIYRLVVQNADEAILVVRDGTVDFCNFRAMEITGISEDKLKRRPFANLVYPEDKQYVANLFLSILTTDDDSHIETFRIMSDDKQIRWFDAHGVAIGWHGQPAVLCFLNDITKRKSLQEKAVRSQRLEAAGQVAGQIAHDFNNLLSPVAAYPALIREALPADSPVLDMLAEIENAADKLASINQQLLTLGRRAHYTMELIDLNRLLHELLASHDLTKDIVLREEFAANLPSIRGGAAQLECAFINLVHNAVEAMHGKGTLTLRTACVQIGKPHKTAPAVGRGNYVTVQVSDTGCGIPEDAVESVFEPFYTTRSKDRKRGSGLGLSIVHSIVETHQAHIEVNSRPGQGTTFTIYFPAQKQAAYETPAVDDSTLRGHERILVVDDDPIHRRVAEQLLKRLGYKVQVLSSGARAVNHVKTNAYDLLVMDMVMDGMDGVEAYRRILELYPRQKAIILSGYAMSNRVTQAMKLGAGSFVTKPVTQKALAEAVRRELDRKTKKRYQLG